MYVESIEHMVFQITESLPTYPEHQKSSYSKNQRTPLDLPAAYTRLVGINVQTIPRSDHDASRSAFTLMNPRQTNSDMSVSPSISSLTLTSVSDSSSRATIIPVENLKKRTLDEKTEEEPPKKRKTLELLAEPLPFYKEARPVLSRMVKTRELVSFLRANTSKELSHAGLTVHYVVYADDIAEYAYNGR